MKITIYSDFDGTATNMPGNVAVFKPFYQSLLINKGGDYKTNPMKEDADIQELFVSKFGTYDQNFNWQQTDIDMLMTPDAVEFFHKALANKDVRLCFVTKNRHEYIRAMFRYQGFSEQEVEKLTILDSGFKKTEILKDLPPKDEAQTNAKIEQIVIADDSLGDFHAMNEAVLEQGYTQEQIHGYHQKPGAFEWEMYWKQIEEFLGPQLCIEKPASNRFSVARGKVEELLKEFRTKVDTLGCNHQDSRTVALELAKNLQGLCEKAFKDPGDQSMQTFASEAKVAIAKAVPVLQRDLGWGDYLLNLAKQLANAVLFVMSFGNLQSFFALKSSDAVITANSLMKGIEENIQLIDEEIPASSQV